MEDSRRMQTWRRGLGVFLLGWLALLCTPADARAQAPDRVLAAANRLRALEPSAFVRRELEIPVEIVFVGYDPRSVDTAALLRQLPRTSDPVVRSALDYDLGGRELG